MESDWESESWETGNLINFHRSRCEFSQSIFLRLVYCRTSFFFCLCCAVRFVKRGPHLSIYPCRLLGCWRVTIGWVELRRRWRWGRCVFSAFCLCFLSHCRCHSRYGSVCACVLRLSEMKEFLQWMFADGGIFRIFGQWKHCFLWHFSGWNKFQGMCVCVDGLFFIFGILLVFFLLFGECFCSTSSPLRSIVSELLIGLLLAPIILFTWWISEM